MTLFTKMKKALSFLLTLVMVLQMIPGIALADDGIIIDDTVEIVETSETTVEEDTTEEPSTDDEASNEEEYRAYIKQFLLHNLQSHCIWHRILPGLM